MKPRCVILIAWLYAYPFGAAMAQQQPTDTPSLIAQAIPDVFDNMDVAIRRFTRDARFDEASKAADAYILAASKHGGLGSVSYANAISLKGYVHMMQGMPGLARPLFIKAFEVYQLIGTDQKSVAASQNNIGQTYFNEGRYDDAEVLYKKALALQETLQPPDTEGILASLFNLGQVQQRREQFLDAELLLRRALVISETIFAAKDLRLAIALQNLATTLESQRKNKEAEALFRRAVEIRRSAQVGDHPELAGVLQGLGVNLYRQKKYSEAETTLKEAIKIRRKALTFQAWLGQNLTDLAQIYILQHRYADAEALIVEALALYDRHLHANHPDVAEAYFSLAYVWEAEGKFQKALEISRKASAIHISHNAQVSSARIQYQSHLRLLWANWEAMPASQRQSMFDEALAVGQRTTNSVAALSVSRMTARLAASDPTLHMVVREQQDLESSTGALERQLIEARSGVQMERVEQLRTQVENNMARNNRIQEELVARFPAYSNLAQPQPITEASIRQSIGPNDAFIFFAETYDGVFVWCITQDRSIWQRLATDADGIVRDVSAFRDMIANDAKYDFGSAYELYSKLFGPIEQLIDGKLHLYIVPSGPLTSLPFSALITAPVKQRVVESSQISVFKQAPWFVRRFAFSILPSVGNLSALKNLAAGPTSRKPMIGFGNPVLEPTGRVASADIPGRAAQRGGTRKSERERRQVRHSASIRSFWRGGAIDADELRKLGSVPATENELKAVAKTLPGSAVYVGREATETAIKLAKLDEYRILYFATHALVSGELGAGEPSLVFSLPNVPSPFDDGLLTASEVSLLKLNADWVVLSACNTSSPGREGAEALSGLAQAFFYAGARSLLVSHWSVDDIVTAKLMARTFEMVAKNPTGGRPRALQAAMLAVIADPSEKINVRPRYWAPFFAVGTD
jgi:CHAT domain-containing protein/Tfp pilus assembly protein PilF